MLKLYAQSFMIATRTDQPQRAEIAPVTSLGQPPRPGTRAVFRRGRELPRLGIVDGPARHDQL